MNMTVDRLGQKHLAKAANLASADKLLFHNALREHYIFKVLHSGMVTKNSPALRWHGFVTLWYECLTLPDKLAAKLNTLFSDLVHAIRSFATLDAQFPPMCCGR